MQTEFSRIKRLPPYVFAITTDLKMAARRKGEDIIDFGMGNPDGPTPKHIVDKLVEPAQRGDTHGYSVSKGIPRLRKAIANWASRRFELNGALDFEHQVLPVNGTREALFAFAQVVVDRSQPAPLVLCPNPFYQIYEGAAYLAGA